MKTASIYCVGCGCNVNAELTDASKIYPNRLDLKNIPMWQCPTCWNFVGCHHKTKDRTKPLGSIPTKEIRQVRKSLHYHIDLLWKNAPNRRVVRTEIYAKIGDFIGRTYHSAEVNSVEDGEKIIEFVKSLSGRKE